VLSAIFVSWLSLGGEPVFAQPVLDVTTLDGTHFRGVIRDAAPELRLTAPTGDVSLDWSEVLELHPVADAQTLAVAETHPYVFTLVDEARFGAEVARSDGRRVSLRFRSGLTAELQLSAIVTVQSTSAEPAAVELLRRALAEGDRAADIAVVSRQSKVAELRGAVRALTADHVAFTWRDRDLDLPWEAVAGLVLADAPPLRAPAIVRLRNGEQFSGRVVGGGADAVVIESSSLGSLSIAWESLSRIECRSDRLVYLSDVRPTQYDFEPFFTKRWPYKLDETLTASPIVLGGRTYNKGIVMHSRSTLGFAIGGGFTGFAATVGIADEMADRGDARMAVVGDGKLLWEDQRIHGGAKPRTVSVDIAGVKRLELVVDYGGDLDLSDHACWAQARLLR
jgi:hypothetical protein